jgi:Zn-dependent alcohol dehydrogenase
MEKAMTNARSHLADTVRGGLLAGAAGGLAEVLWVTLYAQATGTNAAAVASAVTTAAGLTALTDSVAAGVVIHMGLALVLGLALAAAWRILSGDRRSAGGAYAFALGALTAVWAANFFVILPLVSPDFIGLMPYAVSLTSKLLFAAAAAEALRRQGRAILAPSMVRLPR